MNEFQPDPIHRPVMVDEVVRMLEPSGTVLDLTVGAGGHSGIMLSRFPSIRLIGIDRDDAILQRASANLKSFGERAALHRSRFDQFADVLDQLSTPTVDRVLIDLGVSSLQLDDADRGFSFDEDGPLDMRMDPSQTLTAATFLNDASREELLRAIGGLGEEPMAGRIVKAIVDARRRAPFRRTCQLTDLVAQVVRGPRHHHPATRSFMGLRMMVNDELGVIERTIPNVIERLAPGGRLVIIAFHGGEDRVVKQAFKAANQEGRVRLLTTRPVTPTGEEVGRNPRARSARLRGVERVDDRA